MTITLRAIDAIDELGEIAWNELAGCDYPFTRYHFLHALEKTGAVGGHSGWLAKHLLVYQGETLIGLLPSYVKQHSYGEYVFDHAWANAYRQYGLSYYPKLITAIPFTPISGPRILCRDGIDHAALLTSIQHLLPDFCLEQGFSTWHFLFPERDLSSAFERPFLQRQAVHFQWTNEGYQNFDDFLDEFSSRKRKNLRKERLSITQQGIEVEVWEGDDIPRDIWANFYDFYQITYAKRSGHGGYLSSSFFEEIAANMPEYLVLMMAKRDDEYIAGALNFKGKEALYGRYWGCIEEANNLHFELCYYQGIEYCIKHGLARFDPGVQGEHKIQRGFRPTYTYSNHWLAEEGFREPVAEFIQKENEMLADYCEDATKYLPFKKES
jgi:predicted N-acyltransferase